MIFLVEDEGIDSAWTTATRNMSPRELHNWRRSLYSIYVGHLPYDITKVFLLLLPINICEQNMNDSLLLLLLFCMTLHT